MVNNILTLLDDPENNFSQRTFRKYQKTYQIILSNLKSKNIQIYEKITVETACNNLYQNKYISISRKKLITSALNKLDYYYIYHALQPKNYSYSKLKCLDQQFENIVSNYLEYYQQNQYIKANTAKVKRVYDINFMNYLTLSKITLMEIDNQTVVDYLFFANKKIEWAETTKNANLYELRQFLGYLINSHGVNYNSVNPLQVVIGCHKVHLPSYYEPFEVSRLINSIDITSSKGKRDYLICLLVSQLGMRAGDVSKLTFSNIHWDNETIEIVQQKTGNSLVLPLLQNLKFALLDYWKNARPNCSSNTILLTVSKPYRAVATTFLTGIISKQLETAKVNTRNRKHGCHSMRHSLARNLLSENESLSTITGILGHKNSNTTRKYLGINTKELRKISMEVPYGRK